MATRPKAATVDIGLRVKEPMRARIERESKQRGVSMNAEITDRLETSFFKEDMLDRFFGGPEMRRMATVWAAKFAEGARHGAYSEHGPPFDRPLDKKELTDPKTRTYQGGAQALVESLLIGMPYETKVLFWESLRGQIVSDEINARRRARIEREGKGS
jgi:Arc-like DNA binding domain